MDDLNNHSFGRDCNVLMKGYNKCLEIDQFVTLVKDGDAGVVGVRLEHCFSLTNIVGQLCEFDNGELELVHHWDAEVLDNEVVAFDFVV